MGLLVWPPILPFLSLQPSFRTLLQRTCRVIDSWTTIMEYAPGS